jgi:hypothetical protein
MIKALPPLLAPFLGVGADVVESDIIKAVGNLKLKVDLEDLLSAESVNKTMVTAKITVSAMFCIAPLKVGVEDQNMNAINLEEIKLRAIVVILRNEARGAQVSVILEKGKSQNGKIDGHDCLICG